MLTNQPSHVQLNLLPPHATTTPSSQPCRAQTPSRMFATSFLPHRRSPRSRKRGWKPKRSESAKKPKPLPCTKTSLLRSTRVLPKLLLRTDTRVVEGDMVPKEEGSVDLHRRVLGGGTSRDLRAEVDYLERRRRGSEGRGTRLRGTKKKVGCLVH